MVEPPSGAACCAGLAARSRRQAAGAGAPASRSTPGPPPRASIRLRLQAGPGSDASFVGRWVSWLPEGVAEGQLECSTLVEPPSGAACCAGLAARSRRQAAGAGAPASRSTPGPPPPAAMRHPLPAGQPRSHPRTARAGPCAGRLGSPASSRPASLPSPDPLPLGSPASSRPGRQLDPAPGAGGPGPHIRNPRCTVGKTTHSESLTVLPASSKSPPPNTWSTLTHGVT